MRHLDLCCFLPSFTNCLFYLLLSTGYEPTFFLLSFFLFFLLLVVIIFYSFTFLGGFQLSLSNEAVYLSTLYILQNVSMGVCALSQTVFSLHPSASVIKRVIVFVTQTFKLAT